MERPQFQLCFKDFCEGCREMDVTHETLYADGIPFIVTISCRNLERCQRLERRMKKPEADAVSVVRCKDCKWHEDDFCTNLDVMGFDRNDYCSWGERREDGEEAAQ